MKRSLGLFFLIAILSFLNACDGNPLSDLVPEAGPGAAETAALSQVALPTSTDERVQPGETEPAPAPATIEPSRTPQATDTAVPTLTPRPTATPSLTPTPTPTATRRPPPPEAILGMAVDQHEQAASYHFQISEQVTDAEGAVEVQTFEGDYLAPDALSGLLTKVSNGEAEASTVTMFAGQYYHTDPASGGWLYHTIRPGTTTRPDNGYLRKHPFPPAAYKSLTLAGREDQDGRPVYHLSGLLPAAELEAYGQTPAGDVRAEILVGTDDLLLYELKLAYEALDNESGERFLVEDSLTLSAIDQPVVIDAPDAKFQSQEHVDAALGLVYQLPADWTIEQEQLPTCPQELSCPVLHLFRKRPGGVYGEITLAGVTPQVAADLEAVMEGQNYEESEAGDLPARLREGAAGIDGLVYPLPGHAVQLAASWAGSAGHETAVRQIVNSLQSTVPPAAEGFKKHYLPGWGSFDMPDDWYFVNPFLADQIIISSKDADLAQEIGPEDALLQIKNFTGFFPERAIDLLRDQALPSLDYEWDLITDPAEIRVNELEAATATIHGHDDYVEQMTAIKSKDGTRVVVLLSETGAEQWPDFQDTLETIRDSLLLEEAVLGPYAAPTLQPPAGYTLYADDEQSYQFAYPQTWQLEEEMREGVAINMRLTPPTAAADEAFVGAVYIYPPSTAIVGEEMVSGILTADGQLDALANWSGTLEIRDALSTSLIEYGNQMNTDSAAAYYVATWVDGRPIYGFMGAVTDGDAAVKMISWSDDPLEMKEAWLQIFTSIQLHNKLDRDRGRAEAVEPGEAIFGAVTEMDETDTLYSFSGAAGDSFILVSSMLNTIVADGESVLDGFAIVDVGVYDPQDQLLAYQNDVSMIWPAVSRFTLPETGEYVIAINPYVVSSAAGYLLRLLPIDEDNPALIAQASGALDGGCEDVTITDTGARQVAIHAVPVGDRAAENSLSIDILDSRGDLIVNYGDYYEDPGQPVAFLLAVPEDDAFTVRACEQADRAAEFELIIMRTEEE